MIEDKIDESNRELGYSLAKNDLLAVLLEIRTPQNKDLLCEIINRFEHFRNIRETTNYLPNKELL